MFTDFSSFMNWMAGPGIAYLVGIVMSLVASKFVWWNSLAKEIKIVTPIVLSVVFAFAIRALNVPEIVNNPDLNFAFYAIIFYLSTQKQNEANNKLAFDKEMRALEVASFL
jgi:hypothetical protein